MATKKIQNSVIRQVGMQGTPGQINGSFLVTKRMAQKKSPLWRILGDGIRLKVQTNTGQHAEQCVCVCVCVRARFLMK